MQTISIKQGGIYQITGKAARHCGNKVIVESAGKEIEIPVYPTSEENFKLFLKLRAGDVIKTNIQQVEVKSVFTLRALAKIYREILGIYFSTNPLTKRFKKLANLSLRKILFKPFKTHVEYQILKHKRFCGRIDYPEWLKTYRKQEREFLKKFKLQEKVKFLIVIFQRSPEVLYLDRTAKSLSEQTYRNFRTLFLTKREVKKVLESAEEDYVLFLEEGDVLSPSALHCFAEKALTSKADVIYADNDFTDNEGNLKNPWLKPDWSPDYFLEFDYILSPVLFKTELVRDLDNFTSNYEIILSLLKEKGDLKIEHIPALLLSKAVPYAARHKEKLTATARYLGKGWEVKEGPKPGTRRVLKRLDSYPKVSIIIPSRDKPELIERCLSSIFENTDYPNFEVVVVDNNSTQRCVWEIYEKFRKEYSNFKIEPLNVPFNFSKLINYGVRKSGGEVICLLNNDVEITDKSWLTRLVALATDKNVGAVGAKLLYPDGRVQHAGVILGINFGPEHAFKGAPAKEGGYMNRLITTQNYLAVTAACMVFRRDVFEEVGGFNEEFAVNFNDTDFCLRVYERGYRIVWTPHVELLHLESGTRRGLYKEEALKELKLFRKLWKKYLERDPYFHPNLNPYKPTLSISPFPEFYCLE